MMGKLLRLLGAGFWAGDEWEGERGDDGERGAEGGEKGGERGEERREKKAWLYFLTSPSNSTSEKQ